MWLPGPVSAGAKKKKYLATIRFGTFDHPAPNELMFCQIYFCCFKNSTFNLLKVIKLARAVNLLTSILEGTQFDSRHVIRLMLESFKGVRQPLPLQEVSGNGSNYATTHPFRIFTVHKQINSGKCPLTVASVRAAFGPVTDV
jgi:hypothetical protein